MAEECDLYGFFNGIYGLEQSNWANYWRGIIPDGVIALQGKQPTRPMMVYHHDNDGALQIRVDYGEAMVDNHRVWINKVKHLKAAANTSNTPRWDRVVLRVTYGNTGQSKAVVDVKEGTNSASMVKTDLVQNTGGTYEIPLATLKVTNAHGVEEIIDERYVFKIGNDSVYKTRDVDNEVTVINDIEFRISKIIGNSSNEGLIINLPAIPPNDTFITGVNFTTGTKYTGVTFTIPGLTNNDTANNHINFIGDALALKNKRYNTVIWWDSGYGKYWVCAKAVAAS